MGMPTVTNGKIDTPTNATATIKHNGASTEPGITDAERIARKRKELGATLTVPDYTDELLMKAAGGTVQRLRKQGRASTFLSMDPWSGQ